MRRGPQPGRSGFTLIEVMIAVAVVAVALIALLTGLLSSSDLQSANKEALLAQNAAEQVFSGMRGMRDLRAAYLRWGPGGPEETFEVFGLAAPPPGSQVGRVIFWRWKDGSPPDPSSTAPWTSADLQEARSRLGVPFPLPWTGNEGALGADYLDTDGNGIFDTLDEPSLLPVTVRIRWRGRHGVKTRYYSTVLGTR